MAYAQNLAKRIQSVLKRQVQDKGYEVTAHLIQTVGTETLSIMNFEDSPPLTKAPIKIVITQFDEAMFPMPLGDNPEELLDFIRIEQDNAPVDERVEEGLLLEYDDKSYEIMMVSPTGLGGVLVIKECRAKKVK